MTSADTEEGAGEADARARSPILVELRAATRDAHARLERCLPLTSPALTTAGYTLVLAAFHGFYRPLEAGVDAVASTLPDLCWDRRRKLHRLRDDLLALGVTARDVELLPVCDDVPAVRGVPDALGCLYVVEGATLGGQVITRVVRSRLGIDEGTGGAFFDGYGAATGAMWRDFCACLAAAERRFAGERSELVRAAVETFSALELWLAARGLGA